MSFQVRRVREEKKPSRLRTLLTVGIPLVQSALQLQKHFTHAKEHDEEKVNNEKTELKNWALRLQTQTTALFKSQHQLMTRLTEEVKHRPFLFLRDGRQELTNEHQRLLETIRLHLKAQNTKIGNCQKLIDVASPANTLKRGFTITRRKNGNVLKNTSSVHKGDALITEFADGQLVSEVQHVTKENKSG